MSCARIYRRKPSARKPALWSTNRISTRSWIRMLTATRWASLARFRRSACQQHIGFMDWRNIKKACSPGYGEMNCTIDKASTKSILLFKGVIGVGLGDFLWCFMYLDWDLALELMVFYCTWFVIYTFMLHYTNIRNVSSLLSSLVMFSIGSSEFLTLIRALHPASFLPRILCNL